jgi:bacteriocin biosynthesis cyclodehydratase domain-containing protein
VRQAGAPALLSDVLHALPVQLVEISPSALIVKRGRTEVRIRGERAGEVARRVLIATSSGATGHEILEAFAAPDRAAIAELVTKFRSSGFLVSKSNGDLPPEGAETSLDVFYWHFGTSTAAVRKDLSKTPISIIGVNCISRRLAATLTADGAAKVEIIHYPLLCNLRLLDDRGELRAEEWPRQGPAPRDYKQWWEECDPQSLGCVVATSDFGGAQMMRPWNEFCIKNKLNFLPVVLQDLIGYIGPLVVPGETACFECLRARQNSHLSEPEIERAAEEQSFESQSVAGFHPAMASVLGDLAALELSRFYGGWALPRVVGALIEVNLVGLKMTTRRVLRVPRCRVCASGNPHTAASPLRNVFLPGNEWPE